ncbi:MAG TPA: inverse autotransporter beta domain-containing protein, partial [Arsenophonus sp.]
MTFYLGRNKIIWYLLLLQMFYLLSPLCALTSQPTKKSYPLTPFENLSSENYPLEMPEIVVVEKKTKVEPTLPDLGSSDSLSKEKNKSDKKIALGVTQLSSILLKKNPLETSISYAKNIGQGLVNQRINDWLNQYGKARVSFGIDQKFSGEFLLPLIDKPNNIFFTQWGLRTNQERNTINLGLGYRQYWCDWIYGINTFYDYDYTGGNARLGIGGEAWTDYLKLAANGYFRLTDWHQSKISTMDDYYERPASGFDIRAQAYLPTYPKLGGSIKYDKYFGTGVHIGNGVDKDKLENDPYALTLGINYTPIPLLIFKGEHTVGDRNDTMIGLDVIYNFGIPLSQQVDPDSVDVIRSLVGSKYDFVDRNYDIVMQYYKQKLISISLPKEIFGEGNELIIIPVTVHKTKYGLKKINWMFPANFFDNGGTYNQVSPTQLEVNLPAYMFKLEDNTPEDYSVSAVAEDNNGNVSETAKTLIRVKRSKNVINLLSVTPNKIIPANNVDYFTITAFVTNEQKHPLIDQKITFEVEGLKKYNGKSGIILFDEKSSNEYASQVKTDNQGKAIVKVRSTVSGKGKIIAKMENGNHSNQPIEFSADKESAKISRFTVKRDNSLANNKEKNELYLLVTDKNGNPVRNLPINLTGSNQSKIENVATNNIKTNENGELIVYVTNAQSGISKISAEINGDVKTQSITFLSDTNTARVDTVTLNDSNDAKIADGESFFTFNALVIDQQGNSVPEVEVNWQQNKGDLVVLATSSTTNKKGIATIKLQSSKK